MIKITCLQNVTFQNKYNLSTKKARSTLVKDLIPRHCYEEVGKEKASAPNPDIFLTSILPRNKPTLLPQTT